MLGFSQCWSRKVSPQRSSKPQRKQWSTIQRQLVSFCWCLPGRANGSRLLSPIKKIDTGTISPFRSVNRTCRTRLWTARRSLSFVTMHRNAFGSARTVDTVSIQLRSQLCCVIISPCSWLCWRARARLFLRPSRRWTVVLKVHCT